MIAGFQVHLDLSSVLLDIISRTLHCALRPPFFLRVFGGALSTFINLCNINKQIPGEYKNWVDHNLWECVNRRDMPHQFRRY